MTDKPKRTRSRVRSLVGKELAKVRIDHDETLAQMAAKLDMHPTHLTRVEMGTTGFTSSMANRVKEQYGLDLMHLVAPTERKIQLTIADLTPDELAAALKIQEAVIARKAGRAVAETAPTPVAAPAQPRKRASEVDDGVDFIDDLSDLDDLDDSE